eukprot:GGOE01009936.1.p1 GENE.GGOE01009936.1~~GGOE01009936.1.p1  ORF type:complete len:715 (+),score=172.21 GGOE01009936.1:200-2146(+)
MPATFWVYLSRITISVIAVLASYVMCFKSSAVAQHGVFCLLEVALFALLPNQQTTFWTESWYSTVLPSGATLVVEASDGREVINDRLYSLISELCMQKSLASNFGLTMVAWWFLALMGLNVWTVGVNLLIPVVCAIVLVFLHTPGINLFLHQLALFILFSFVSLFLAIGIERTRRLALLAETKLVRELQASQAADSILNHTLKNVFADVAGIIELFLASAVGRDALEDALMCLMRGTRLCKQRNVCLKLAAGEYIPIMNVVNLKEFGHQLVAGRNITGSFPDLTVNLDCTLLTLVMENGISNAVKHGHAEAPDVCLAIHEVPSARPQPGHRRLCFSISNTADPLRPELTPDVVQQLLQGKAKLQRGKAVPQLSEHIGLSHCVLAVQAGGFDLHLRQEGQRVVFSVEVDAEVFEGQHENINSGHVLSDSKEDEAPFPAGLIFAILDDSLASQRWVEHHLRRWCAPTDVLMFGAAETDVEEFLRLAPEQADVVVLDQHLEFQSRSVLGTDVVARLRQRHYRGLICIRSAADSPEDRICYMASGAHCTLGKELRGGAMVEELKAAYLRFRGWQTSLLSLASAEQDLGLRCVSGPQLFQCGDWAQALARGPFSPGHQAIPALDSRGSRSAVCSERSRDVCSNQQLPGHVGEA